RHRRRRGVPAREPGRERGEPRSRRRLDTEVSAKTATRRHVLIPREEVQLVDALPEHSSGLTRAVLIGEHTGATHTGLSLVALAAGGHVEAHVHSYETGFYVLSGEPVLYVDGRGVRLKPGACGALPV